MLKTISKLIAKYIGILVVVIALIALFFPQTFSYMKPKLISPMLGLVMFGMGLTLNLEDFKIVFSRPKDILIGSLAQFSIMPLLAYALAKAFNLPADLALGVILVGCCPGGTASNVMTYLAGGDLALSVGMTGVSTILAPFITPLMTNLLAGKAVDVDVLGMFLSILEVVILPIAAGFLIKHYFKNICEKVTDYLPGFSSLMIALIVGIIVSSNAEKLYNGSLLIVAVIMLHNLGGLTLGYTIGKLLRLEEKKRVAISIEVGMQNSGLASSLAQLHFAQYPMATIPGAIFSVWHNISGALVAKFFWAKNKQKK